MNGLRRNSFFEIKKLKNLRKDDKSKCALHSIENIITMFTL